MLGSSNGGLQFAAEKGLGFAFAAHISSHLAVPMLRMYRETFQPSSFMKEPKSILALMVITADTDEEAQYLAAPAELQWVHTYFHPNLVDEGDLDTLEREVTRTEDAINNIVGYRTSLFRPPYGFLYN